MRITCKHAHELLSQQMDQRLSLMDKLRLTLHLRICEMCRNVAKQMDFMRKAIRRMGE